MSQNFQISISRLDWVFQTACHELLICTRVFAFVDVTLSTLDLYSPPSCVFQKIRRCRRSICDSRECVTWLMHMTLIWMKLIHSYSFIWRSFIDTTWSSAFTCVTNLMHMWDMTHGNVWLDSCICACSDLAGVLWMLLLQPSLDSYESHVKCDNWMRNDLCLCMCDFICDAVICVAVVCVVMNECATICLCMSDSIHSYALCLCMCDLIDMKVIWKSYEWMRIDLCLFTCDCLCVCHKRVWFIHTCLQYS